MSCSVQRFLKNVSYNNLRFMQFLPQRTFLITPRLIPVVTRVQNRIKIFVKSILRSKNAQTDGE